MIDSSRSTSWPWSWSWSCPCSVSRASSGADFGDRSFNRTSALAAALETLGSLGVLVSSVDVPTRAAATRALARPERARP